MDCGLAHLGQGAELFILCRNKKSKHLWQALDVMQLALPVGRAALPLLLMLAVHLELTVPLIPSEHLVAGLPDESETTINYERCWTQNFQPDIQMPDHWLGTALSHKKNWRQRLN